MDDEKKYTALRHYIRCHDNIGAIMVDLSMWSSLGFNVKFANIDGVRVVVDIDESNSNFFFVYHGVDYPFALCSFDEWYDKAMQYEAVTQTKSTLTPPPSAWCEDAK